MLLLLPFLVLAAALSVIFCITGAYTGLRLVILFLVLFAACFAGSLAVYVLILAIVSLFIDADKPQKTADRFFLNVVTYTLGLINVLSGVRIHMSGADRIPTGRFVLVSNHRSGYDPIITGWALRGHELAFISKPENMRLPVVGKYCHKCGYLALDRDNDRAALRTILEAAERIRNGVMSYAVYPEGTRSRTGELLPFRNGAFKMAQRARAPIVVMTLAGADKICRRAPFRKTDVYLRIRQVISADEVVGLKTNELGERIRSCMLCEND